MSIPVQNPIAAYTGNGSATQFAYLFYLVNDSDLTIQIDGVVVSPSLYTLTGLGNITGGNVVFTTAPSLGARILLQRILPLKRDVNYVDNGDLLADTVNADFDRIWMALQDVNTIAGYAVRVTDKQLAPVPQNAAERAGRVLTGDINGNPVFSVPASGSAADVMAQLMLPTGGEQIGWKRKPLQSMISTAAGMLNAQSIYCYEFANLITVKGDVNDPTTWDWTPAIDAAIAYSKADKYQPVVLPHHAFITTGGHVPTTQNVIFSGGSTTDGKKYKGVPIVGYGQEISRALFKPANPDSICIQLAGSAAGHKTQCYLRGFTIEPYDVTYQFKGYGIEYLCVNYANTKDVAIYFLAENFRLHNGIAGGWTEFNSFDNCFSYRGTICYSFVRTLGNDSFHGTMFNSCFGQIIRTGTGGYGIKCTGVSSTALVWVYNSKLDIKFYGNDPDCKLISLTFAEMTNNHGDITCEGTILLEALDDFSRMLHAGNLLNNGNTTYSTVTEIEGAQGRFVFENAQSKSTKFVNASFSDYTPFSLRTTPNSYSVNGAYPALFRGTGPNFSSPFLACYDFAGNGLFIGRLAADKSLKDFNPAWWFNSDGSIIQSWNSIFRFRVSETVETFRVSASAVYPFINGGMTDATATQRWGAGYYTGWNITSPEIIPTSTATSNIGRATLTINNLFMQNAVTVVSDINYKANKVVLSEKEEYVKLVAAVGTVKFNAWQMKAAIAEKGADLARWHFGVIAQELKEAITEAGLQWDKYGVLTYDSCDQIVTKGEDGNYYPVLSEEENAQSEIPVNEAGYIEAIAGADSTSVSEEGVITYTRCIYMIRMEEFLTLRMAYIESKLS